MKRPSPLLKLQRDSAVMESAMTPMIDVVFLLLVFFVWTASFQIVEQILPSEMSSQIGEQPSEMETPPPEADFDNVVVSIDWNGIRPIWSLNKKKTESIEQLSGQLMVIHNIKPDRERRVVSHRNRSAWRGD